MPADGAGAHEGVVGDAVVGDSAVAEAGRGALRGLGVGRFGHRQGLATGQVDVHTVEDREGEGVGRVARAVRVEVNQRKNYLSRTGRIERPSPRSAVFGLTYTSTSPANSTSSGISVK